MPAKICAAAEGFGASGLIVALAETGLPFSHCRNKRRLDGRAREEPLTRTLLEATQIIPTAIFGGTMHPNDRHNRLPGNVCRWGFTRT
ncbi:MAG: hypothetical protein ACLQDM_01550 [Bradyrhizobium sp.]